jgi:nucleoside-diphosphate-sugar epimerase
LRAFANHAEKKHAPVEFIYELLDGVEHLIAGAALIGGISYFHSFSYDLLATNERIIAATCDAAIRKFGESESRLKKVTYLSSSMVFESTNTWPSKEGEELEIPPPKSSYGFQKLAVEDFAKAAWDQYGLPYTILRPFNCGGIGEYRAKSDVKIMSGDVSLAMSHVVPDLIQKIYKNQNPLRILGDGNQIRCYTYGEDLAKGIVSSLENTNAYNNDYNLSTREATSVNELAEKIWAKMKGKEKLEIISEKSFKNDVSKRIPDCTKAEKELGFKAETSLDDMLDIVIPWVTNAADQGLI